MNWKRIVFLSAAILLSACSEPVANFSQPEIEELEAEMEPYTLPPGNEEDEITSLQEVSRKLVGKTVEDIHISNRAFVDARIKKVTEEGILVQHLNGVNLVRWEQLSDDLKHQWGYE